jgi:SSS family solute:Na+ symporter
MNGLALSQMDWIVFCLIVLSMLGVVVGGHFFREHQLAKARASVATGQTSKSDAQEVSRLEYLVMGRSLTLPMFVATLVATWNGGILGVTQISFEKGIFAFVTQGALWYIAYLIFAFGIASKVRQAEGCATLPDYLRMKFGPMAERIGATFNFIDILPIVNVISLGVFLEMLTGWDPTVSMFLGLIFVLFYSFFGGFRAVVYTDMVQFVFMYIGIVLVVCFSFNQYGGLEFLQQNLPASYWDPTDGDIGQTVLWGFIALSPLADPNFYHRCMAAKTPKVARNGLLLSVVFWFIFDICTTIGGMYAKAVMPMLEAKTAYLTYSLGILGSPLKGLFLGAIIATILSNMDSNLFLGGATASNHLLPESLRNKPVFRHGSTMVVGLLSLALSTLFNGNVYEVWKTLGSYSTACLLVPLMLGIFLPVKISDRAFAFASFLGIAALTAKRYAFDGWLPEVDEFYFGLAGSTIGVVSSVLITWLKTSEPLKKIPSGS